VAPNFVVAEHHRCLPDLGQVRFLSGVVYRHHRASLELHQLELVQPTCNFVLVLRVQSQLVDQSLVRQMQGFITERSHESLYLLLLRVLDYHVRVILALLWPASVDVLGSRSGLAGEAALGSVRLEQALGAVFEDFSIASVRISQVLHQGRLLIPVVLSLQVAEANDILVGLLVDVALLQLGCAVNEQDLTRNTDPHFLVPVQPVGLGG